MVALLAFFVASGAVTEVPHRIAFTFDDGPSFRTTPALLEALDRWGVRAAFFVNGYRFTGQSDVARLNRAVLRMAHDRGHTIGSHTFRHLPLRRLNPKRLEEEIVLNEEAIAATLGERPTLFRPPYGRLSRKSQELVQERGYRIVLWDVSPLDHHFDDAERLRDHVLEELFHKGGGVVILHDTYTWTVRAFEMIMEAIERENCRLLTEGELPYQIVSLQDFLVPRADPKGRERWLARLGPSCRGGAPDPLPSRL